MTDPKNSDETFTWTEDAGEAAGATGAADSAQRPNPAAGNGKSSASEGGVLESLRDAIDDLAAMAGPALRDISVRAAELAAVAADRAAPIVKRVGDATSEASAKAADRTRSWASEQRTAKATKDAAGAAPDAAPQPETDDEPPA